MVTNNNHSEQENGFVLVAALLILLVLTVMGTAVNRNTALEWRIAMNDRDQKDAFYMADAATELASEVLEQSIACLGFDNPSAAMILAGNTGNDAVRVELGAGGFWRNFGDVVGMPSDTSRDLVFPDGAAASTPHANINIGGDTKLTTGAAIQMASGYEGLGKAIGSGGISLIYDINVQQIGNNGSESTICIQYGHILGAEGDCYY